MKKYKKAVIQFIFLFLILLIIAFIGSFVYYFKQIPNIKKLSNGEYSLVSRLYTNDGVLMQEYSENNRYYVSIEEIPQHVIQAFLAAEDANFFNNIGIDIRGIVRAFFRNIYAKITGNGGLQGASTITQQLVKNILLTNERTLERKIKEIILSIVITKELSKERILEMYLNYIFLGYNAYGVESAAMEYFGKHIKDVNVQEAATLASMPKAPSVLNPRANYEKTLERRNWVLEQMRKHDYIDAVTHSVAKQTPIIYLKHKASSIQMNGFNATADFIKRFEIKKAGVEDLFTGGYFIKSTIDSHLQETLFNAFVEKIDEYQTKYGKISNNFTFDSENWCRQLREFGQGYGVVLEYYGRYNVLVGHLVGGQCKKFTTIILDYIPQTMGIVMLEYQNKEQISQLRLPLSVEKEFVRNPVIAKAIPQPNGGGIVIDSKSGKVLAIFGDYFDTPNGFNRATQAYRQVGSTIKPFVYQAAFENGLTPSSIFIDEPITLGSNWKPDNYNHKYLGAVTLRRALELSLNIPTVRVADSVGIRTLKNIFTRFELVQEGNPFDLSVALGSVSVTPMQLAKAYSVYQNKGKPIEPSFIEYIQDRDGNVVYQNPAVLCEKCSEKQSTPILEIHNPNEPLTSPEVAYQVHSLLEGAVLRGTARKVSALGPYIAGKTGTTNDSKDSWFVGYNDKVIIAVYVGFDEPQSLGDREYGATLAMPIFMKTMEEVLKSYPSGPFNIPSGIKQVSVNYYTGKKTENGKTITEYFKYTDDIPAHKEVTTDLYGF